MSDSNGHRHFRTPLMVLLIGMLALASYHWTPKLDFTGLDAGPLLQANRFDEGGGPLRCFVQEIRDGIEPGVAFYRPLTGLSHGFDYWVWGLDPSGHQLSQLVLHMAVAVVLLALLLALGVPSAGALLGAAWFAVHPLGVEVVPCIARRAELWVSLWLLLACLGWLRRESGQWAGGSLLLLAGLLAPLSKETGAALPALLFVLAPTGRRRAAMLWGLALVAPALIAHTVVLGGLGGYGGLSFQLAGLLPAMGDLFNPARVGGAVLVPIVGVAVLLLSMIAALRGRAQSHPLYRFGLAWIALLLLPATFARGISPWYLYTPLLGLAILVAGLFVSDAFGVGPRRRVALAVLILLVVLPGFMVSPMAVPYPEWRELSRHIQIWRDEVATLPEDFFEGPQLVAGLPYRVDFPARNGVRVRAASGLTDFSLRAWTQLIRGRDSDPHNAALVRILFPSPHYSVQVSWMPKAQVVHLRPQGSVSLTLYGEEHPFEVLETAPEEIVMSALEGPLWRWNGKYLARVKLTPAPPDSESPTEDPAP